MRERLMLLMRPECRRVALVLQTYLDGQCDEITAGQVSEHLRKCRRCGLESRTYVAIQNALIDSGAQALSGDSEEVRRLRAFARGLASDG